MYKALTLLLFILPYFAFADTFTVTSNADAGPGTLREALQKAINNGSAITDHIEFNLPYSSDASVTITLKSALPILSSNLVIDGTTQPSAAFGISNAKIKITVATELLGGAFDCFYIYKTGKIEIYGLYLDATDGPTLGNQYLEGIRLFGAGDVIIGKPGKGNVIKGWGSGIVSSGFYNGEFDDSYLKSIKIQSNFIGLDADGEIGAHNISSIATGATDTVIVGGPTKAEGNYLTADRDVLAILLAQNSTGSLNIIQNNVFNTNVKGTQSYSLPLSFMLAVDGTNSTDNKPDAVKTFISNNLFGGTQGTCGIGLGLLQHKVKIYANKFGDEINNSVYVANVWISVFNCSNTCIIGDNNEALKNTFTKGLIGIRVSKSNKVLITKDSFYCNVNPINNFDTLGWVPPSFIEIHGNKNGVIRGKCPPSAKIEAFINHDCVSSDATLPYRCQGKKYVGFFNADAQGNWTYNNPNSLPMVFTATVDSSTSEFSNTIVDTTNLHIINSSCDKANGSITGLNVESGVDWNWRNSSGVIVGTDTNLLNVKAGWYTFTVSQGENGCEEKYFYFIDSAPKPVIDTAAITIIPASCGQNTGSIYSTRSYSDTWSYSLLDSNHMYLQSFSNFQTPIGGLFPGKYFLNIALLSDDGCNTQYGPFKITNQPGPSLNSSNVQITGTTCGQSNGSIKNITYKNGAGNIYIAWIDAAGNIVGNSIDLTNVPAGKYKMKLKDGGGCDTVFSEYFVISDTGSITFDVSRMQITPSSCKGTDGSIKKITSVNAETYTWVNTATGGTVGSNEDLTNIPAGSYRLSFSNSRGCTASTNIINVTQQGFLSDTITMEIISDPNCDLDNGFVKPLKFTRDTTMYSFEWLDTAGNLLSTNTSVYNLKPGHYTLYATDPNGCRQAIFSTPVIQHGKPVFLYAGMQVLDDTCNQGKGAIKNLLMKDIYRTYTWQWYTAARQPLSKNPYELTGLAAGDYYAEVTDQFNCTVSSTPITIKNYDLSPAATQATDQFVKRGQTATITVTNIQTGSYNLYDTVNATVPVNTSTTGNLTTPPVYYDKQFYLQYVQGDCKSPLQQVWVKVYDSTKILIPNAFSPNNDGINDTWRLQPQGIITNFKLLVFNRYGQIIYTANDIAAQWDGKLKGNPLPVATYYYVIQYRDNFNRPFTLKGFVVIVR